MILKSVELNNYGAFKGSNAIDFSQPSIKRVTLIGGLNGSGKTTIFESIQLCLFGSRSELHKENNESYIKFLEAKINRDSDKKNGCAIKLVINLSDDVEIENDLTLVRSWKLTTSGIKEELEVFQNDILDTDLSENWIEFISSIISPSLSKLFLFDSEKILKYAEPAETSKLLIQGIQTLIGADLIVNLEDDLGLLKKNILKDANPEEESEMDETESEINKNKKLLDKLLLQRNQILSKLETFKDEYEKVQLQFQAKGFKTHEKVEELERQIIDLKSNISTLVKDQINLASRSLPLKMPTKHIRFIEKEANKASEFFNAQNKIDAWKERDKFFMELLGDELSKTKQTQIKKALNDEIKNKSEILKSNISSDYFSKSFEIDALNSEINSNSLQAKKNTKDIHAMEKKLEALEKSLARVPDDQISKKLFSKRDKLLKDISASEVKLDNLNSEIETKEISLSQLQGRFKKQFDERIDQLQSSSIQKSQLSKIKVAERILQRYNKEIITRSLSSFESMIADKFKYLNRKESLISHISIDRDHFTIQAFNKNQEILLKDLSAGERQLLAISILWSLYELSQTKVPVVIDTPLARLDSKHRSQLVTKYFPVAGVQTVILSTDEEIIGQYYKAFKPYVGKEYLCSEKPKTQQAEIKEGYF